jgi:hypothetical protein
VGEWRVCANACGFDDVRIRVARAAASSGCWGGGGVGVAVVKGYDFGGRR